VSNRPACVVNLKDVPLEKRPRFTATPGVAAMVQLLGDATGLKQMGVSARIVQPGFSGTNRHFHTVEEEWTYILSGRGTLRLGPLSLPVRAGHFAGYPPGPSGHHLQAEGDEPLVFLEGGERRPTEDDAWYPDTRQFFRRRQAVENAGDPPPEHGDARQLIHEDDVPVKLFQHDLDPNVRRRMRVFHKSTGLQRQAVKLGQVDAGVRTTVLHTHDRTDEWVFILRGRASVQLADQRFEVGPNDFVAHPAGSAPHAMEAIEELTYLMGGQSDPDDVVTYPEAGLQLVAGELSPIRRPRSE
jgi:uncharacterized cupin superfamily protein